MWWMVRRRTPSRTKGSFLNFSFAFLRPARRFLRRMYYPLTLTNGLSAFCAGYKSGHQRAIKTSDCVFSLVSFEVLQRGEDSLHAHRHPYEDRTRFRRCNDEIQSRSQT